MKGGQCGILGRRFRGREWSDIWNADYYFGIGGFSFGHLDITLSVSISTLWVN